MSDFEQFQREKILIVVEEGEVTHVVATDNIEVVLIDKDEGEFTDFYEADALGEVESHEVIDAVIDGLIKEFHEDMHGRKSDGQEEE